MLSNFGEKSAAWSLLFGLPVDFDLIFEKHFPIDFASKSFLEDSSKIYFYSLCLTSVASRNISDCSDPLQFLDVLENVPYSNNSLALFFLFLTHSPRDSFVDLRNPSVFLESV